MTSAALILQGVTKRYGSRRALDGLSFQLPRGSITGLIGPNGAGKTTCFGIIGGLLTPDAGQVNVLGRGPFDARRDRGRLGLVAQDCEFPAHSRVETYLRYLARLQGASTEQAVYQTAQALDQVALSDRGRARMRELSHGMRRRVAIAQALLGAPDLMLLDEPTNGLDPHLVAHMRELMISQRARGASLLVSSHILSELEAVCDHVVFIDEGRATASGSLADVTARSGVVYFVLSRPIALTALSARLPGLNARYEGNTLQVRPVGPRSLGEHNDAILKVLTELGAGVLEVRAGDRLEDVYLRRR